MAYLILNDYFASIQNSALQQILTDNDSFRLIKQEVSISEIKTYLTQKYDVSDEFRDTVKFDYTSTYKAKQLVYLDATAYSPLSTYLLNALTLYSGNVYYANVAIGTPEAFNLSKWTLLGVQYAMFYIHTPKPEFNYKTFYLKDDQVFWKDKVYKCLVATSALSQESKLQYTDVDQLPNANQFPDSTGQNQWELLSTYSVTGIYPTVTATYTLGDNRNAQLVEIAVYLTIYKLSPRISPKNVPEIWEKNYLMAIDWLKNCAKGKVTLDAPLLQPDKGGRIRWGSKIKNTNTY